MANIGSGYGGGGAGGGERTSDNFTTSSAGADGRIQLFAIEKRTSTPKNNFKVNVGGNIYRVQNIAYGIYPFSAQIGKLSFNTSAVVNQRNRFYSFKDWIDGSSSNFTKDRFIIRTSSSRMSPPYRDITAIANFKAGIGVTQTKIVNDGIPLSVLYNTSDAAFTYQSITTLGNTTGIVDGQITPDYPSNYTIFYGDGYDVYAIVQAAGGGGGGADSSWGLFNYAAGGGGGGGGGAAFVKIVIPYGGYLLASVGRGGAGGSNGNGARPAGTKGGNTVLSAYNSGGTLIGRITCTGGGGGGGANGDSAGSGGARGQTNTSEIGNAITVIAIVDGGLGGSVGTGGAVATSGTWSTTSVTDAFDATIVASNTFGSGGTTGSQDDRGGGGGASWLGNGGYY